MGALGAAISGLQSSQKWLDVISNNVSNQQTVGFKTARTSFSDLVSQGMRAASGASNSNNLGGINPTQLGLGVTVSSVQNIMTQGAISITGNATDVAVQGSGFFTVEKGNATMFTRAGNFTLDNQGNLVTPDGGLVQGWSMQTTRVQGTPGDITTVLATSTLDTTDISQIGAIQIPKNLVLAPQATANEPSAAVKDRGVILRGNLDANTPMNPAVGAGLDPTMAGFTPDAVTSFVVYDSLGNEYSIKGYWIQTTDKVATPSASSTWDVWYYDETGGVAPSAATEIGNFTGITFNSDGSLADNGNGGLNHDLVTTVGARNGAYDSTAFTFTVNIGTDATADTAGIGLRDGLTGDYGGGKYDPITGVYQPVHTVYTDFVDGYMEGTLIGMSVDQTGGINCTFSNNQTITYAKLAMTNFTNPEGLEKSGGNYWVKTANSGMGQIGTAGANGFGVITGGALESSNVDLTVELTNMIVAQRMFESNARVVTSADSVLETLVNLGR